MLVVLALVLAGVEGWMRKFYLMRMGDGIRF
jgi:hypothetical protein